MKTEFTNAQNLHKSDPKRFKVPSKAALFRIKRDDNVKVCTGGERFWVCVTRVDGNKITGVVNNDLVKTDIHGLTLGQTVEFELDNVYDIIEF